MSKLKNEPISIRKAVEKELSFSGVHLSPKESKHPTQQCRKKYERNIHEKNQYTKYSSNSFAFRPLIVSERVNWQWPIGLAKKVSRHT